MTELTPFAHCFSIKNTMCHIIIVNSYMINRSRDLNQKEVEVLCFRGCTGHCLNHACISIHVICTWSHLVVTTSRSHKCDYISTQILRFHFSPKTLCNKPLVCKSQTPWHFPICLVVNCSRVQSVHGHADDTGCTQCFIHSGGVGDKGSIQWS